MRRAPRAWKKGRRARRRSPRGVAPRGPSRQAAGVPIAARMPKEDLERRSRRTRRAAAAARGRYASSARSGSALIVSDRLAAARSTAASLPEQPCRPRTSMVAGGATPRTSALTIPRRRPLASQRRAAQTTAISGELERNLHRRESRGWRPFGRAALARQRFRSPAATSCPAQVGVEPRPARRRRRPSSGERDTERPRARRSASRPLRPAVANERVSCCTLDLAAPRARVRDARSRATTSNRNRAARPLEEDPRGLTRRSRLVGESVREHHRHVLPAGPGGPRRDQRFAIELRGRRARRRRRTPGRRQRAARKSCASGRAGASREERGQAGSEGGKPRSARGSVDVAAGLLRIPAPDAFTLLHVGVARRRPTGGAPR